MWNLKNNINEKTKNRNRHRYKEQTYGCERGRGLGASVKGEGGKKYKLVVTKWLWGVMYSIENIVNSSVITT